MPDGYELVGGTPVTVEPLEVSENGTYQQPRGKAYNPVKVNVSSGAGVFYADYTEEIDPDSGETTWSCDKTLAEITSAYNTGAVVIGRQNYVGGATILQLRDIGEADGSIYFVQFEYARMTAEDGTGMFESTIISHYNDGGGEVIDVQSRDGTFPLT